MSIIDTFDPQTPEIIRAIDNIAPSMNFPQRVVGCFSEKFENLLLSMGIAEPFDAIHAGGEALPIYRVRFKEEELAFFRCWIGGPAAAATLEELIAKGGRKFLYFGSCGAISNLAAGHLIVPTEAYRDEGVSYHYLPADDYAPLPGSSALTHIFDELTLPYAAGRVWTTDSFYRETRGNMAKRQQDGCLAVDMECASLAAAAAFRGVEFCQFLYAADSLTGEAWDKRILGGMTQDARSRVLSIALEAAIRL